MNKGTIVALLANLLLAGASARSLDNGPLALTTATSSSAEVKLFSGENEVDHVFQLSFNEDVGEPKYCEAVEGEVCVEWSNSAKLRVEKNSNGDLRSVHASAKVPITVCFDLEGSHLYGGPVLTSYPAENANITELGYITGDFSRYGVVMAVTERYWYTSKGLNLHVAPEVPLFITQQKDKFCLTAKNEYPYSQDAPMVISYETCLGRTNIREAVQCFFQSYDKPIPPAEVIGSPIWSTWVEFKRDITQEKAIQFLSNIKSHNFRVSVMEIDDAWETCYGSQVFDKSKFPDPKAMVDKFRSEGYLTTIWVHPFVGPGCPSLDEYAPYLIKLENGSIGLTQWWNGEGALINFNDPKTVEWYQQRLVNIQKTYGFDSFKFDAGEVAYIPGMAKTERSVQLKQPNMYTTNYVKAASKFGSLAEVRVGSEAHQFKIMQRLQDTNSVWEAENLGLRSVIKSVIQLSLHGYGAILPDMVGGNCYGNEPSKELFIRWMQLNTFLPVIQFSLAPWKYDQETIEITRKFTDLHYQYKDRILKEFKDTTHPVINPIWWIDPLDSDALITDSEFLLGEDLLVAPVLEEGAVSRDIYLPVGTWKDMNTGKQYEGSTYLRNYNAPLHILPYFERVGQA